MTLKTGHALKRIVIYFSIVLLGLLAFQTSSFSQFNHNAVSENTVAPVTAPAVYVLTIDDEIISPVTVEYISQGIEEAQKQNASALVVELDTPGGLLNSTHTIVKEILNAPLPVIVYVSPTGARAGSAGVFITMAAHVAAMNPSSHIGAAHPVDAQGNWPDIDESKDDPSKDGKKDKPLSQQTAQKVMNEKIMNDTVSTIRVIAKKRGRNQEWAVKAVTESASITADEALAKNVVDVLAPDLNALMKTIHGTTVEVNHESVELLTQGAQFIQYEFSLRQQILSVLTHPLLSYFLLMIGIYGLFFEVTHPGFGVPGILGVVFLILGLVGMQALSINLGGLGLILLGMGFFVAEVFTPTFGLLLGGGHLLGDRKLFSLPDWRALSPRSGSSYITDLTDFGRNYGLDCFSNYQGVSG